MNDLEIEIIWHFEEPVPPTLLQSQRGVANPQLDAFLNSHRSWHLRVCVCETCSAWIAAKRKPELRKIRSILDRYALPRLVLPQRDPASHRDDFIALIGLFAAKAQCLAPRDEDLPRFFRSYCDRLFGGERKRRKLSEADWYGLIDRVFERLYRGEAGSGFTMPAVPGTFRAYIRQAVRGQAASVVPASQQARKPSRFPASIKEAANSLGVSHMTVRRYMSRLHFPEWTEQAWLAVSETILPKKRWQDLTADLRVSGLKADAARKRVQRLKQKGLTPKEARCQDSAPLRKGTCTACGEEQVPGELHQGKFFCAECFREKKGISTW
jgi:hypothetical protein